MDSSRVSGALRNQGAGENNQESTGGGDRGRPVVAARAFGWYLRYANGIRFTTQRGSDSPFSVGFQSSTEHRLTGGALRVNETP